MTESPQTVTSSTSLPDVARRPYAVCRASVGGGPGAFWPGICAVVPQGATNIISRACSAAPIATGLGRTLTNRCMFTSLFTGIFITPSNARLLHGIGIDTHTERTHSDG